MNWFRVILVIVIALVGIIVLIFWHKKIDSETTWIYGIYVLAIIIIFSLSVLIIQ